MGLFSLVYPLLLLTRHVTGLVQKHRRLEWLQLKRVCVCWTFSSLTNSCGRGQVRNAFNLTSSPAGSSSGSGQVITANMAAFSLGTEVRESLLVTHHPSPSNRLMARSWDQLVEAVLLVSSQPSVRSRCKCDPFDLSFRLDSLLAPVSFLLVA